MEPLGNMFSNIQVFKRLIFRFRYIELLRLIGKEAKSYNKPMPRANFIAYIKTKVFVKIKNKNIN